MSIYNKDAYFASLWDWKILKGCFGNTLIEPTDVDGLIERNGKFLLLETKLPGVKINKGQEIMFDNLIKINGFTILVIWGHPGCPEQLQFWRRKIYKADIKLLRTMITRWFQFANKG